MALMTWVWLAGSIGMLMITLSLTWFLDLKTRETESDVITGGEKK